MTVATTCHDASLDPTAVEPVGLVVFGLIGLFGGAHCLGMCGPLVTTYADRLRQTDDSQRRTETVTLRAVRQHALFNVGRTASYAILGGLFGLAGSLVFVTPRAVTSEPIDDVTDHRFPGQFGDRFVGLAKARRVATCQHDATDRVQSVHR